MQPILEAERVATFRQFAELHTVHDRNLLEVVMTLAREVQDLLQVLIAFGVYRQGDVRVRCAERILPIGGRIGAGVIQDSARAAMPCRNSIGKLSKDACGTPNALSPSKVKAIPNQPGRDGTHHSSAGATCGIIRRNISRPCAASSMRRTTYSPK